MTALRAANSLQNTDPIRAHVEMLHGLAEGIDGVLVVSAYHAAGGDGTITHHRVGDVDGMIEAIEAHSDTAGANVYVGLQVMRRGLPRGKRGKESDILAVLGLVADMDGDTGRNTGEYPVPPNYTLETSPGNLQPFWLFDRPVKPAEAKAIAQGLKVATGADHCTADITHVWRIPRTKNWPSAKKLARGRSPEPASVTVAAAWDGSLTDPLALMTAVGSYSAAPDAQPIELGELPDVDGISVSEAAAALLAANNVENRSDHAATVVERLAFDGHNAETTCALFLSATGNWFARYQTEGAARKDFARVWSKYGEKHAVIVATGARLATALVPPRAANDNAPAMNPFTSVAAGGLMGQMTEWILSTSRRRSPELAVMASIAFVSAVYGRRVVGPTGCGVNLYLAGIAGPGFGKEAPLQRLVKVLQDTEMAFLVGAGEVSSSSAIEKILRRKPAVVMPWDEIGDVLEAINARGPGNWAATIRKAMLELYSKSTGVWFGKETTDEERLGSPIHCPSLTVIGTSTPARFYGGMSDKNLNDGFAARMVFIAPTTRPERGNPRDNGLVVPRELREAVIAANKAFPWPGLDSPGKWRTPDVSPSLVEVPWADDNAERSWLDLEDWQENEIDCDETRDGIVGRVAENAVRLATLRALSRGPVDAAVTVEDVQWAKAIMMASIRAVDDGVEKYMTSSQFEGLCQSILMALRSSADGSMYRAELLKRRGIRGADTKMFRDALVRLQETGDIEKTDGARMVLARAGK